MMENKVSIIIPTYNRKELLSRAIESVRRQTYKDWELIIVDDHSTDNTSDLVRRYSTIDGRIKYLKNERKKGPSGARNHGILHSIGEYIAFLDSDDEWTEHHLSECVNILKNSNIKVCFALWILKRDEEIIGRVYDPNISKDRQRFEKMILNLKPKIVDNKYIFFDDNFYEKAFIEGGVYCTHINTLVINREVVHKIGLFNEDLHACEDSDFVYRVIHYYPFCLIDDYHLYYYQSLDSIYNFFDRNNLDLNKALYDEEFIKRFTFISLNQIKMNALQKKNIRNSKKIFKKDICIKKINKIIGEKYFAVSFLNYKLHKLKSIYFCFTALFYKFSWQRFLFFIKLILPIVPIKINWHKLREEVKLW